MSPTHNPTHNVALTEAAAVDGMFSAPAKPAARTPFLPMTLPFAHAEIMSLCDEITTLRGHARERAQIVCDQIVRVRELNADVKDNHVRIEGLKATVRDLEVAIYKRDAELVEKRAMVIHHSNQTLNAEARVEGLQMCVDVLTEKVARRDETIEEWRGEHADALTNVQHLADHIEELKSSLAMMTEIADVAARDADKHLDNARDLSQLLDDSGKREDRSHETLMGIRALAESAGLSDHEKVALILRLA